MEPTDLDSGLAYATLSLFAIREEPLYGVLGGYAIANVHVASVQSVPF